jgi:signal transduction histidine kinase
MRESAVAPTDIDCDIPGDITVMAEPALLASSFRNVLANAVEYRSGTNAVRCTAGRHSGG